MAIVRSSTLDVPDAVRGMDRIIEIARQLKRPRLCQRTGGRALYESLTGSQRPDRACGFSTTIAVRFHHLQRILEEDREALSDDILASSRTSE